MPRCSDWLGLPVVGAGDGRHLGRVQDVLLDPACRRVAGLVVGRGLGRPPMVVGWPAVRGVDSAVVCDVADTSPLSPGGPATHRSWRDLHRKWVLTDGGRELGLLWDLWVDGDGAVTGYQLSSGLIEDLWAGQPVLAPLPPLHIGPDAVLVSDASTDVEAWS